MRNLHTNERYSMKDLTVTLAVGSFLLANLNNLY